MTYICYVPKKFRADRLKIIGQVNDIIAEFAEEGYTLTLRQLFYQYVSRGLIENTTASYSRLGTIVSDGRLAGLISWEAIEDRDRHLAGLQTFTGPSEAIKGVIDGYHRDLWEKQEWRPEVWCEKKALIDVVKRICDDLRVDYFACRGYVSQSEQWRAGQRLAHYVRLGQRPIVFHLGDHDPSGIDMTRDNQERLSMFAGVQIPVVRLALNMDQIEEFNPPPNPAKRDDSRFEGYVEEYGEASWELDALDPRTISKLISDAILRIRDDRLWDRALLQEVNDKRVMTEIAAELE